MTDNARRRAELIFQAVADVSTDRQAACLAEQCGSDVTLRREVESLLARDRAPRLPLTAPWSATQAGCPKPGDQVGAYTLIRVLGEGGWGVVFEADQTEPVRRTVALKVVKPSIGDRRLDERFRSELRMLERMDHPSIARVLDAGTTRTGQPYFAMELVRGAPITDHCDRQRLTLQQRLNLFVDVCHAVQHAHQKGIAHRDLKPSNILVGTVEGSLGPETPIPKIIDFGIAMTVSDDGGRGLGASIGERVPVGTVAYMSPEQAGGGGDVDARTDIYSLGVVLYELLAGVKPFDQRADLVDALRTIREVDPPPPSTRLRALPLDGLAPAPRAAEAVRSDSAAPVAGHSRATVAALGAIAAARATTPSALLREISRELEWIPLRAIRRDPAERYQTPNELADDIRGYLNNRPLKAGPQDVRYFATKFIQRNRRSVVGLAVLLLCVLGGAVGTGLGWWRAATQRVRAEVALEQTVAVKSFLTDAFQSVDPYRTGSREATVVDALGLAVRNLDDGRFTAHPLVDADLRSTIAGIYLSHGRYHEAARLARDAMDTRERVLGADHLDVAESQNNAARAEVALGRFTEAEQLDNKAIATRRGLLGARHELVAQSLNNLAGVLADQGRLESAERSNRDALAMREDLFGHESYEVSESMNNLGLVLGRMNRLSEAEEAFQGAIEVRRRVRGAGHVSIAHPLNNLAGIRTEQRRFTEAAELYGDALSILENELGPEHPLIATTLNNLGSVMEFQGRREEAERLYASCLDMRRRLLDADHPLIASSLNNVANMHVQRRDFEGARAMFEDAIAILRARHPDGHPETAKVMNNLAGVFYETGDIADAERLHRESLQLRRGLLRAGHPDIAQSINNLAGVLSRQNKLDEADALYREALEIFKDARGPRDRDVAITLNNIARVLRRQGRPGEAEPMYRQALEIHRSMDGPEHVLNAMPLSNLADTLVELGRPVEAEEPARESLTILATNKVRFDDPRVYVTQGRLGRILLATERFDEAEPVLVEAHRAATNDPNVRIESRRQLVESIVTLYTSWSSHRPEDGDRTADIERWTAELRELKSQASRP